MSDPRDRLPVPADDGELLSAYLDGELDDRAAAELEARLSAEPALAAQLERTREIVETLAWLRASPPPEYAERLRERLAAERGTAPLEAARAREPRNWSFLAAAAGLLVLALVGGTTVLGAMGRLGGQDEQAAMDRAAGDPADGDEDAEGAQEPEMHLFADDDADRPLPEEDSVEEPAAGTDADDAQPAPMAASQPSLVDAGTVLDSAVAAREHLSRSAAPAGVLGMALERAEEVAAAYRVSIQRAEPFTSAVRPDRCLEEVLTGARGPAVAVEVEAVTFEGSAALAYLVVTATAGSDRLDRVEGWVVEPDGCATRTFSDVSPDR